MPLHNVIVDEERHPFDVRPHYKRIFLLLIIFLVEREELAMLAPAVTAIINRLLVPYFPSLHKFRSRSSR